MTAIPDFDCAFYTISFFILTVWSAMKFSTIISLVLLDSLSQSCVIAWTQIPPSTTTPGRSPIGLQLLSPPFSDAADPSTSRRQWLGGITSAAFGAFYLPLVADAADLVTSPSSCDPSVSIWKKDGRLVYLLGTAHISSASATLAGNLVKDVHPSGVFVELDPKRIKGSGVLAGRMPEEMVGESPKSRIIVPDIQILSGRNDGDASSSSLDPSLAPPPSSQSSTKTTIRAADSEPNPVMKAATAAVGSSIKGMYKKLDSAGFQAGEEFVVAMREGQRIGSDIVLGDRDVEVTLRRVAESLARTDLKALMNPDSELEQSLKELVPSEMASGNQNGADIGDLSDEEFRKEFSSFVETMKAKENVRKIMNQLERVAPALYEALVSERDAYMAAGLNGLYELETIVAVMGVAHVDGVERNLSINGWKAVQPTCALRK